MTNHYTNLKTKLALLTSLVILAGCAAAPPPSAFPEGSNLQSFIHNRELMQRELIVTGSVSRVIPARIFNVRYTLACLEDTDDHTARSRFNEAATLINEKLPRFVEGSTRSNPFYRMGWPRRTNDLIVDRTGCEAAKTEWITLSEGRTQALKWVIDNGLTKELILYSRGLN